MPRAEGVAVVALRGIARRSPKVAEVIGGGRARLILLVAERREGPGLVAAPARAVAVLKVHQRRGRIHIVAGREHGAGDRVEDRRGGLAPRRAARRHRPRSDQRDGRRRGGYRHGLASHSWGPISVGDRDLRGVRAGRRVGVRRRDRRRLARCAAAGL